MTKKELLEKSTVFVRMKNNEMLYKLEEIYFIPNPKYSRKFSLIVKQNGKFISINNQLRTCQINSSVAVILNKYGVTCISGNTLPLSIYIVRDFLSIYTDWNNYNVN